MDGSTDFFFKGIRLVGVNIYFYTSQHIVDEQVATVVADSEEHINTVMKINR